MQDELERQVDTLVTKGYPTIAGLDELAFRQRLAPLVDWLDVLPPAEDDRVPFVVVLSRELVPPSAALAAVELGGKPGFTDMAPDELAQFRPIDGAAPPASAYLLADVDTGRETLDVTPDVALATLTAAGRSPLTIEEGIALVTHHPAILRSRNCFSLLGSRRGDRRVPALWVKKEGNPRLGWCWAGNPHSWLGSASCGARLGAAS